ncbi:beta-lactamase domain-containing protein [Favolaschia claudopus]|uniref:Beta-lactamase domain-containing protein n=1 Tax=Favolaschia claudopus TaxID=2862362 RepID=A0AAV9Z3C2_9AGAR
MSFFNFNPAVRAATQGVTSKLGRHLDQQSQTTPSATVIPFRRFHASEKQSPPDRPPHALRLYYLFLASTAFVQQAKGTATSQYLDDKLDSVIQNVMKENNIAGLSLGILSPSGSVEFGAWGNRTETGDKVTPDTIFGIGSLSKSFLSASLGILMQDFQDGVNRTALPHGVTRFDWDTKVAALLPGEWKTEDDFSTKQTDLVDLLSHITGLPTHDLSYSPDDTPRDLFRQHYEYNNQMYVTASYIVSKFSGIPYRDFVEQRILLPLNMSSSTLHPDRVSSLDRFSKTWSPSGRRIPFFADDKKMALIAGAGGVISDVQDLLQWAKLILNGGVVVGSERNSTVIIPSSTFNLATTGHSIVSPAGDGTFSVMEYGLGWLRTAYRGHESVMHNGGAPGVSSMCAVFPLDNFAVVLLSNTAGRGSEAVVFAIADRILGLPTPSSDDSINSTVTPTSSAQLLPSQTVAPSTHTTLNLAGTYSNAGYGNFTLCSSSKVNTVTGISPTQNSTELYSVSSRFWGTHIRLTPVPGTNYDYAVHHTNLYVDGYGADKSAFEDPLFEFKASFMEERGKVVGFGLFVAEGETWRAKKGGSVRDVADAWFDKV